MSGRKQNALLSIFAIKVELDYSWMRNLENFVRAPFHFSTIKINPNTYF